MVSMNTQIAVAIDWSEIAAVVDRYEDAGSEELPDVAQLLQGVTAANRPAALVALLQVEQEHRWKRRHGKTVEEYVAEYPELAADRNAVRELARSECQVRCGTGERDFRKDFSRRFPELELECDTLGDPATTASLPGTGRCQHCPLVRPTRIGRYLVEARIGSGSFGVVYRCRHPELDRLVAIKVARSASGGVSALLHEAQNVVALTHPNIVGLLDYGKLDDGRPYIVYEYVAGRTLAQRIAARDYTLGEAIRWTIGLSGALQAAHRRRIYHRDVKPANVLVDEEGTARLTDFGLARRDDVFYLDDRGARLGTFCYMSPEQASYRSDWSGPAADIYSLGVVLYELLCGRVPFCDTDAESLAAQIKERPPVPLRSLDERIPAGIDEACLRALQKDPAKRFRTAGDCARALQTAIEPRCFPRRTWLAAAAAAVAVALGLVALGRFGRQPFAPAAMEAFQVSALRDGDAPLELKPERLPRTGDKLRISAQVTQGSAFWYAIVFTSGRPPQVLASDKVRSSFFETPQDRLVTVPEGKGVMAVVLGARSEPLTGDELDRFTAQSAPSFDKLQPPAKLLAELPHRARPGSAAMVRGGDNRGLFDFPEGFKGKLEELFPETYYAEMFPWYDIPPRSAQPESAATSGPGSALAPQ
jgi:hypothetical protein